jgi:hypothetical protein
MKPHPRIRKAIKWGGAAVTLLLVVVWIGSYWRGLWAERLDHTSLSVVFRGGIHWAWHEHTIRDDMVNRVSGMGLFSAEDLPQWPSIVWPSVSMTDMGMRAELWIPLWLPTLAGFVPTALAWRLDTLARRRARLNLCPKCRYDRAGLAVDARCPECGNMPRNP